MKIAIPSYKRADILVKKTLSTLKRNAIDLSNVYVFVSDYTEFLDYKKAIIEAELFIKIEIGVLGITKQRNFIKNFFKEVGEHIVCIDDDIEAFEIVDENKKFSEYTNLNDLINNNYDLMKKENVNLWGVYGAKNGMYMSNYKTDYSVGFYFIIGCCYGYIVEEDMTPYLMDENNKCKQDYEQTLLHYREKGGVIRLNKITMKTKFYQEGGLGKKKDRIKMNNEATEILLEKYPTYFRRKDRKDGTSEVKLIKQKK